MQLDSTPTIDDAVNLAIETTGRTGSIAILRGSEILLASQLDNSSRTASTLAPAIRHSLGRMPRPNLVSVAVGPGSFTGLRVGVTTAKSLAYALDIPVVGIDSLAAIAREAVRINDVDQVAVAINAYRRQVYAGHFDAAGGGESMVLARDRIEGWIGGFFQGKGSKPAEIPVAGDEKLFSGRVPLGRQCDAVGVALIAAARFARGDAENALTLRPKYLKPSAAEEIG